MEIPTSLFLMEFNGWWEDEPDNGCGIYVNPGQVTVIQPHSRDDKDAVEYWAMIITGFDIAFIVHESELNIISKVVEGN